MIRANCSKTIYTIITAAFLLMFAVMINGCENEIVPTESVMDDAYPAETEAAPDVMKDIDTAPNDDNGSGATEVKTGEKLTISLPSNPTTGYGWDVEFDTRFLELIEQKYEPAPSDLIGSGGVETFVFLAHREGEVVIKLKYQRPWENQPIEEQTRKVTIIDTGISILNGTAGETITISLISNLTTGYSWQPEFDPDFLTLVDTQFISDSTNLGAPGMETFDFLMLKAGEVKVKMTYKRPWEDAGIDEHVTLIRIHP